MNGSNAHPLFQFLKAALPAGLLGETITWHDVALVPTWRDGV